MNKVDKEKMIAELRFREIQQYEHITSKVSIATIALCMAILTTALYLIEYVSNVRTFLISVFVGYFMGIIFTAHMMNQYQSYIDDMYESLYESIKSGTVLDFKMETVSILRSYIYYKRKYT